MDGISAIIGRRAVGIFVTKLHELDSLGAYLCEVNNGVGLKYLFWLGYGYSVAHIKREKHEPDIEVAYALLWNFGSPYISFQWAETKKGYTYWNCINTMIHDENFRRKFIGELCGRYRAIGMGAEFLWKYFVYPEVKKQRREYRNKKRRKHLY